MFISLTVLKTKTFLGGLFDKAHVFLCLFTSHSSWLTIAAELTLVTQAPFWATWFTVAMGELASLLVGCNSY